MADLADVESIFLAALEKGTADERAAFLDDACGPDRGLRGDVERLLEAHRLLDDHRDAGTFLRPIGPDDLATRGRDSVGGTTEEMAGPLAGPGTVIGPYKLMEQIGEGGMGTVFVADQHHPVRRRVALKVIKPGMDTKQVLARFEAERQALALMDHPNIAKVFDAGATAEGRPYFVMELVKGLPITDYCDKARLSVRERLDLFVLVCRAVQHAHQKGIIHRDLKPTNVLVTLIDGAAVPKVIDFGVAKTTGGPLADGTIYTAFAQLVGTPLYMSPEQAGLSGVDVDTRSDVYALGVLLYELLTGTTPIDGEALRRAAYEEVRRIIREHDTPTPSTRLGGLGATLAAVSANRHSDARGLGQAVRGELDWIVMKALEKDRARRYESAGAFADDVMRHLADEPVEACPPSAAYRFAKLARRNRAALTTAALVGLALVAGAAASAWQAVRATRAGALATRREREARGAAAESAAVLRFVVFDMLGASEAERGLGRDIKLAELLANADKEVDTAFLDQPLVEASVRGVLSTAYHSLGRYDVALRHAGRAHDLRLRLLGPEHPDTLNTASNLADLFRHLGESERSRNLGERTLEIQRRILGPEHPGTLSTMTTLASVLRERNRFDEARSLFEQILEIQRRTLGPEDPQTLKSMNNLALLLRDRNRFDEARQLLERTLEIQRRVLGPEHPDTLSTMLNLATAFARQSKFDEARALREKVLEIQRRVRGPEHPDTLSTMNTLANLLRDQGKFDEARELCEKVLEIERRIRGPEHPDTLGTMNSLAMVLKEQNELEEARALFEQILEIQRRVLNPEHRAVLGATVNLALVLQDQGKLDEARALHEQTLEILRRVLGPEHRHVLGSTVNLAIVLEKQGRYDEARKLLEPTVAVMNKVLNPGDPFTLVAQYNLAVVLHRLGKLDEARRLLEPTVEARRRSLGPTHPDALEMIDSLAELILSTPDASADDIARALESTSQAAERSPSDAHRREWLGLGTK